MHFDTEVVVAGMSRGDVRGRVAHPEPDFQHLRRCATEQPVEVERLRGERNPVSGHQLRMRAAFARRSAGPAANVTTDAGVLPGTSDLLRVTE
jgi:hypothetical protein